MNEYVIAKYIRLSVDDVVSKSMSIPNQHRLIDKHIEELDIPDATILEFTDNGYTGTNTERPNFQEMIDLVSGGNINCIIVKDFSRFSRNALESGYYIEKVLPLYGVRFISVSDGFDSNNYTDGTGGIDMAFSFLIHEHYSKDLSNKIKSSLHIRIKNGEHIVANAIYGYRKNENGKWEPDPEAAEVVKMIFRFAIEGMSTSQIRDELYKAQYPAPKEYSDMKRGKDVVPKYNWGTKAVLRMLRNVQYTGSYVAGKHESSRVGTKTLTANDESKWIVIPDMHPPIICKEDFEKVQDIVGNPKEYAPVKPMPSNHSRLLRSHSASGIKKPTSALYGYTRLENGSWEIDNYAADVVRSIFDMALKGLSSWEISDRLFEAGHPSPSEYFKLKKGENITPANRWRTLRIREIIKNEAYTGVFISGRTFQDTNGKKYHAPKSDWIVIPDMHPPIISKEMYDNVQDVYEANKRKNMRQRSYLLAGKVRCGCCGHSLSYSDVSDIKTYTCMHTHSDPDAKCHKMKVNAHELESAVMAIIKKQAEIVLASDNLSGVRKMDSGEKRIADCNRKIRQYVELQQKYFEQFITGEIDRDDFNRLKNECSAQLDSLNKRLVLYKQEERNKKERTKLSALAKGAVSGMADPHDVVNSLVEKVSVFPDNQVEILWKFADFTDGVDM